MFVAIRIKTYTICQIWHLNHSTKTEEPQEDYNKIILDIYKSVKMTLLQRHLHKFAGDILKAGHVSQIVWWWYVNGIDPK